MGHGIKQELIPIVKLYNSQLSNEYCPGNPSAYDLVVPGLKQMPHWGLRDVSMGIAMISHTVVWTEEWQETGS